MAYFIWLLLLPILVVGRLQVNGDSTGFAKQNEDVEAFLAGPRPVFDEPWFPVESEYPIGGQASPVYLPNISPQQYGHPPMQPVVPQHRWHHASPQPGPKNNKQNGYLPQGPLVQKHNGRVPQHQQHHHQGPETQAALVPKQQQDHHRPLPLGPAVRQHQQHDYGTESEDSNLDQQHHQGPIVSQPQQQHYAPLPHGRIVPEHQQQYHGSLPLDPFIIHSEQQHVYPSKSPLINKHLEERGDHPLRRWQGKHQLVVVPKPPTVLQRHDFPSKISQHHGHLPWDPKHHYHSVFSQEPYVPKQQSLDSVAQGPEMPTQSAKYFSYPTHQPSMSKQSHGLTLQVPTNPKQRNYSTRSPQRKRYSGKQRGEMIKWPQKPSHVSISRPSLYQKLHY